MKLLVINYPRSESDDMRLEIIADVLTLTRRGTLNVLSVVTSGISLSGIRGCGLALLLVRFLPKSNRSAVCRGAQFQKQESGRVR